MHKYVKECTHKNECTHLCEQVHTNMNEYTYLHDRVHTLCERVHANMNEYLYTQKNAYRFEYTHMLDHTVQQKTRSSEVSQHSQAAAQHQVPKRDAQLGVWWSVPVGSGRSWVWMAEMLRSEAAETSGPQGTR